MLGVLLWSKAQKTTFVASPFLIEGMLWYWVSIRMVVKSSDSPHVTGNFEHRTPLCTKPLPCPMYLFIVKIQTRYNFNPKWQPRPGTLTKPSSPLTLVGVRQRLNLHWSIQEVRYLQQQPCMHIYYLFHIRCPYLRTVFLILLIVIMFATQFYYLDNYACIYRQLSFQHALMILQYTVLCIWLSI